MKKFLTFVFALLTSSVYAQNFNININDLRFFGDYKTAEDIFDALGEKPTKIRTPQPTDEEPNTYIFFFDKDIVEWVDGKIEFVNLYSNRFAFNGLICVGDKISDLEKLGGYIDTSIYEDIICWYPTANTLDYDGLEIWFRHSKEGIITNISVLIM